ncbi:MinD-like ATPase involved in chromosome partitioning or flagellar assembly [Kineococcus xinjiangensis]|uniref:MinD-like ATPase involved in chromosome partitioning or flagellar assembly n=1 Tax=Kineococcus xinjiangensis TaxID=512762 RepID=A0A2S6IG38_9ACTN|nr:chromosome partitioning protein [Kineococcus xinjiangensis]PPK93157.1 MinD-like ATPase involved in chromosome partitioning or flagellar assembly [Kineococcus xinjiangensis]
MTVAEPLDARTWPCITVVVRADASAEVSINGVVQPVAAADVASARRAVLEFVTLHAADALGRPVHVAAVDPDGEWNLLVHPDGRVEEATDPAPGTGRAAPGGVPQPHQGPVVEPVADRVAPVAAVPAPRDGRAPGPSSAPPEEVRVPEEVRAPEDAVAHEAPAPAEVPVPQVPVAEFPVAEFPVGAPASATPAVAGTGDGPPPTLDDLIAGRRPDAVAPAGSGWRSTVRKLTGGLVSPGPGVAEMRHRMAVQAVQRSFDGPRTIVVVNPKGGAHKTTATLLMAATFGLHRGGSTLAWDNNETRGTLGWRANPARHHRTAVDLLRDLDSYGDARTSRIGDLDRYVRAQGAAHFDVLASDEDAASSAGIDAAAFERLHASLSRFYRVMVVDTGNNMRASNWQAAVRAADQLVIVSTVREDTAQSAAWLVDALRAAGSADLITHAVTVLSSPARTPDPALRGRLHEHFNRLTRAVVDVPHDPSLVSGGPVDFTALTAQSRHAWLRVCATVANGL